jgi:glycosyltransferase involved in cell wall biosynthesis
MLRNLVDTIPNVARLPNQQGLARILPQTKLLLMPSRGEESWGRTVTEAQICGIPVLGSSRGNLPVTIGPGGVTLDPDEPIERWLEAFDSIMDDDSRYEDLSSKARTHGDVFVERVEIAYQKFENVLRTAVARPHT